MTSVLSTPSWYFKDLPPPPITFKCDPDPSKQEIKNGLPQITKRQGTQTIQPTQLANFQAHSARTVSINSLNKIKELQPKEGATVNKNALKKLQEIQNSLGEINKLEESLTVQQAQLKALREQREHAEKEIKDQQETEAGKNNKFFKKLLKAEKERLEDKKKDLRELRVTLCKLEAKKIDIKSYWVHQKKRAANQKSNIARPPFKLEELATQLQELSKKLSELSAFYATYRDSLQVQRLSTDQEAQIRPLRPPKNPNRKFSLIPNTTQSSSSALLKLAKEVVAHPNAKSYASEQKQQESHVSPDKLQASIDIEQFIAHVNKYKSKEDNSDTLWPVATPSFFDNKNVENKTMLLYV